jgi:branched-chain amino acid transport system substrate-binding protein
MKFFLLLLPVWLITVIPVPFIHKVPVTEKAFAGIKSVSKEPVKIGLLIQDKFSLAARQGAEMAVKSANDKGGIKGRPLQLVVRSMEGPWGMGSKQAVHLIFEENVWALLGSHDGRNAHLVEQAATKSTVVFVSVWSSDPTLSQAFVPWFFTCVPTDRQQADALIDAIYNKRKIENAAVIHDQAYDSNMALKYFLQRIQQAGKSRPALFDAEKFDKDPNAMADQIIKSDIKAIVLFCQPAASLKIIRLLRQSKVDLPVFATLAVLNEDELSLQELKEFDNRLFVPSMGKSSGNMDFQQAYRKSYGIAPGMVASYAFDGMNALIEAIRISGEPDREKIQQALSAVHFEGVTGMIKFDGNGNRMGSCHMYSVNSGCPLDRQP